MFKLFRMLWKLLVLAGVFGVGYIIGREHSFEENEEWEAEEAKASEDRDGEAKPVAFEHVDEKATSLAVVGDFNDWNKDANLMTREGNTWKTSVKLKPGRHEYKFVVNATEWIVDPKCGETVADKYGGKSSVIKVS